MKLALVIAALAIACKTEPKSADTASQRYDKVVEAMRIKPGSRVADIGAGPGRLTVHVARAVAPSGRVVATDLEAGMLEELAQRAQDAGLTDVIELRVVEADQPGLDGEDGQYDAILLAEVDHYFQQPVAWFKTAARALKPTGRFVITNRVAYRARSLASAQSAGLVLESESMPASTHFIATFVPSSASR